MSIKWLFQSFVLLKRTSQATSLSVLGLLLFFTGSFSEAYSESRPNIVLILADDLGWNDVGYHGSEIKTPHIDSIAASGVQLENFYVTPVCTQTRIALMTGRYPHRMGLHHRVIKPESERAVPLAERFLSEALKGVGYRTAIIGKWHLGHARPEFLPMARGFDYHYGNYCGQVDYFDHTFRGERDWHREGSPVKEEGYTTKLLAQDAARYIREHGGNDPFFLYVPFTAPHGPIQAPESYIERYKDKIEDPRRRLFAAAVSVLDDGVGDILSALKDRNLEGETIVIFSSDNGGSHQAGADNSPYRGQKRGMLEGSIKVPTAISWKGVLPAGKKVAQPLHMVDLYPTLLTLAGASLEQDKPLDGLNIMPVLKGKGTLDREYLLLTLTTDGAAVRKDGLKLIHRFENQNSRLFDIINDPAERKNIAKARPEEVEKRMKIVRRYAEQVVEWSYDLVGQGKSEVEKSEEGASCGHS